MFGNRPVQALAAARRRGLAADADTHEPTLIGEVTLNIRSMFKNRSGTPRSEVRSAGLDRDRGQRDRPCPAGQHLVAPQLAQVGRDRRDAPASAAGEEVDRDLPRPHRFLDHRLSVVGADLGSARAHATSEYRREQSDTQRQRPPRRWPPRSRPRSRRGVHRVRWEAIHLGLVEQQEEGPGPADAVVLVGQVQLRLLLTRPPAGAPAGARHARADRPARRTGSSSSDRPARRPAPCRPSAGRSRACTSTPGRRPPAGRARRTGRRARSSRSRCTHPPGPPRSRTRSGTALRSGTRRGRRRRCSACTRPRPSASGCRRPPGRSERPPSIAPLAPSRRPARRPSRASGRDLLLHEGHVAPRVRPEINRVVVGLAREALH